MDNPRIAIGYAADAISSLANAADGSMIERIDAALEHAQKALESALRETKSARRHVATAIKQRRK